MIDEQLVWLLVLRLVLGRGRGEWSMERKRSPVSRTGKMGTETNLLYAAPATMTIDSFQHVYLIYLIQSNRSSSS
jgi:hypothetical protein